MLCYQSIRNESEQKEILPLTVMKPGREANKTGQVDFSNIGHQHKTCDSVNPY